MRTKVDQNIAFRNINPVFMFQNKNNFQNLIRMLELSLKSVVYYSNKTILKIITISSLSVMSSPSMLKHT